MSKEKKFYVYAYLDPRKPGEYVYGGYTFEFEPFYIGKGRGNRCKEHIWNAYGKRAKDNMYKSNKIKKIKIDIGEDPKIIKVKKNLSETVALNIEADLISLIGRFEKGGILTNMTDGGGGGHSGQVVSEETKRKISEAQRGEKNHNYGKRASKETRRKLSNAHKGEKHHYYNKHFSEEHRKNLSEALKGGKTSKFGEDNGMYGKKHTKESLLKMSMCRMGDKNHFYGKHHSEETKKLLSEINKGENNPFYGKHLSKEHKRNISEGNKGKHYTFLSQERKNKISIATKGEKNPMYGKNHVESTKEKMRQNHGSNKPVLINNVEYVSISEAARCLNRSKYYVWYRLKTGKEGYKYLNTDNKNAC